VQVLAAVIADAAEYGLIDRNPAASKKRRLPTTKPRRTYLDNAEHIAALLDAAGQLDRERSGAAYRKPLLGVLVLAGLRIGEALDLRWRDVQLASGRLRVRQSKTDAGVREVDIRPLLRDELAALAAMRRGRDPNAIVFATSTGKRQSRVQRAAARARAGRGARERAAREPRD
jgi:integrase